MPPTARSSPPILREMESDDLEIDDDIPSLDDIIPWSGTPRKPRQPEVFDPVFISEGIVNTMFLQNVLKSYFTRDGVTPEVTVDAYTQSPMSTPSAPQRSVFMEVTVEAVVGSRRGTYHMVLKTVAVSEPMGPLSAVYSFDRREVGLYIEILDDINVFQQQEATSPNDFIKVPSTECYFARYTDIGDEADSDSGNLPPNESVVVMENYKEKGFTHTLIQQGLSKDQVLTVFEGIARLHGLSLAMKERSGIPLQRSYPYLLCMREASECIVELFDKNVPKVLKLLAQFGALDLHQKVSDLRPILQDLILALARPEEPVSVLSHMNLWSHNILFKGNECVFVDWQMVTCARPTFDLAFLLASSVKANVRRRYIKLFLNHYYRYFTSYALRYGLNIKRDLYYTKKHLRQDFCYSQLLALLFYIAKSGDLMKTREAQLQFVDYLHDLDEQHLLLPELVRSDSPEYVYWVPRNPSKCTVVFRVERRPSTDESSSDPISDIFSVFELPEDE